jgi:hypothetical protein
MASAPLGLVSDSVAKSRQIVAHTRALHSQSQRLHDHALKLQRSSMAARQRQVELLRKMDTRRGLAQ